VRALSFETVVQYPTDSSFFSEHALLYHIALFGEHAAKRFIIRHESEHTDCVDNDIRGEKRSQLRNDGNSEAPHRVSARNLMFLHKIIHG